MTIRATSGAVGQAADVAQQGPDSRPERVVFAHRAPPAGFPLAQPGGDEASETGPAGAKPAAASARGLTANQR